MMLILVGIIGCLLIVFSLLLFWTAYNSYKERMALQDMINARREANLRAMDLQREQQENMQRNPPLRLVQ